MLHPVTLSIDNVS